MKRRAAGFIAPSIIAVASVMVSAAPVLADLSGPAAYEIESKEQYCADATTRCITPNQRPDLGSLRFALFEAYRITTPSGNLERTAHASVATPEALLAKCAGPHSMDSRGNIHSTTMSVMVGPGGQNLDPGTISGSVSLRHGLESDTVSTATVALEVADSVTRDSAVITGTQVANNARDTLVSGGFNIAITGAQYDEIVAGPDANESAPPTPTGTTGTMWCSTGNPSVSTPGAPAPYFESELNDVIDSAS
ncbi:MAG: hypothetical protein JO352_23345 [Chloroflexi bacterium]|nr:hypothetical protein [Chloroflexota bacterium]MBV9596756.1 hypothetical protein [Chloroflexota bacterium]